MVDVLWNKTVSHLICLSNCVKYSSNNVYYILHFNVQYSPVCTVSVVNVAVSSLVLSVHVCH